MAVPVNGNANEGASTASSRPSRLNPARGCRAALLGFRRVHDCFRGRKGLCRPLRQADRNAAGAVPHGNECPHGQLCLHDCQGVAQPLPVLRLVGIEAATLQPLLYLSAPVGRFLQLPHTLFSRSQQTFLLGL